MDVSRKVHNLVWEHDTQVGLAIFYVDLRSADALFMIS